MGVRTFTLTALLGLSAQIAGGSTLVATGLGAIALLFAISYYRSGINDPGLTTEVSLIATYILGALAHSQPNTTAALGVSIAALLAAKRTLHGFIRNIMSRQELTNGVLLGLALLVLVPLAPKTAIDPWGALVPNKIAIFVTFVLAIDAASQVATRIFGNAIGAPLAGLLGGLISASATVASMGARARIHPQLVRSCIASASFSNVTTVLSTGGIVYYANPALALKASLSLSAGAVVAIAYSLVWLVLGAKDKTTLSDYFANGKGRPLNIQTAVVLASIVTIALGLSAFTLKWLGETGFMLTSFISGFADAQSGAFAVASVASGGQISNYEAVGAILTSFSANTITKFLLAASSRSRTYILGVATGLTLVLLTMWGTYVYTYAFTQ